MIIDPDYELEGLREYCAELEDECYEEVEKHYLPIPETDEERERWPSRTESA
jgi:hypothetical protein